MVSAGSPSLSASPSGPPSASIPSVTYLHDNDVIGRPSGSGRPPPQLTQSNIVHGGSIPSNISTRGYSSNYGGSISNPGISEYGSQNRPQASYGSSSSQQLRDPSSRLFGGGSSGYATPGSSGRSRPPSAGMYERSQ
jgi:hypothetical protein